MSEPMSEPILANEPSKTKPQSKSKSQSKKSKKCQSKTETETETKSTPNHAEILLKNLGYNDGEGERCFFKKEKEFETTAEDLEIIQDTIDKNKYTIDYKNKKWFIELKLILPEDDLQKLANIIIYLAPENSTAY